MGSGRVYKEAESRGTDQHGRTLAYLWVEPDGVRRLVDEDLAAIGVAYAWRRDGQYGDRILAAEDQARKQGKGCLWRERPPDGYSFARSGAM